MQTNLGRRQCLRTAALTPVAAVAVHAAPTAGRGDHGVGPSRFFFHMDYGLERTAWAAAHERAGGSRDRPSALDSKSITPLLNAFLLVATMCVGLAVAEQPNIPVKVELFPQDMRTFHTEEENLIFTQGHNLARTLSWRNPHRLAVDEDLHRFRSRRKIGPPDEDAVSEPQARDDGFRLVGHGKRNRCSALQEFAVLLGSSPDWV